MFIVFDFRLSGVVALAENRGDNVRQPVLTHHREVLTRGAVSESSRDIVIVPRVDARAHHVSAKGDQDRRENVVVTDVHCVSLSSQFLAPIQPTVKR